MWCKLLRSIARRAFAVALEASIDETTTTLKQSIEGNWDPRMKANALEVVDLFEELLLAEIKERLGLEVCQ